MAADGAAGRDGEAFPFFKDKAAVPADRGSDLENEARTRRPGDMVQVPQDFFFRAGEDLG